MDLWDTHFHLSPDAGTDPDLIAAAAEQGVRHLLALGGSPEESQRAHDFASGRKNCFFGAGICPSHAASFDGDLSLFRRFAEDPAFVCVGEIGLDTCYESATFPRQTEVFQQMLSLALELKVPAEIHCRGGEDPSVPDPYPVCHEILCDFVRKGGLFDMHCFAGSPEYLEKFAELGGYFGVGGMVTFRRAENIRELVKRMPEDRILLETDSPYLTPVPFRGKPNSPAMIPLIAEKIAEVRGIPADQLAEITTANAERLFLNRKGSSHAG